MKKAYLFFFFWGWVVSEGTSGGREDEIFFWR